MDPLAETMSSWSPYNYVFNNPIAFVDPFGLSPYTYNWTTEQYEDEDGNQVSWQTVQGSLESSGAIEKTSFAAYISFDDYPIDVAEATGGKVDRAGLGHGGILLSTQSGNTQYYEFGRYDSGDQGLVRRKGVNDISIGSDGIPTLKSVDRLLRNMSKSLGKGSSITASFFQTNDLGSIKSYIDGRLADNSNPDRKPYSIFSSGGYNCVSFASCAIRSASDIHVGPVSSFEPGYNNSIMQKAAQIIYYYNSSSGQTSMTNKLRRPWWDFNLFGDGP